MSRREQLIQAIRRINPSAQEDFLNDFDDWSLNMYLSRLTTLLNQRGRDTGWVRVGDTPAIVTREAA